MLFNCLCNFSQSNISIYIFCRKLDQKSSLTNNKKFFKMSSQTQTKTEPVGFDAPDPKLIKRWHEKNILEKLQWYYNQYSMSLCLSILEPWERHTFNFFFCCVILAITYWRVWGSCCGLQYFYEILCLANSRFILA